MKKHVIILFFIPFFFLFACSQPNNSTGNQINTTTEENPNTPAEQPNTPTEENPDTPAGEQQTTSANKYRFLLTQYNTYQMNENGEYDLSSEISYSYDNFIYNNSILKYTYITKNYDNLGRLTSQTENDFSSEGNTNTTNSITENYTYPEGIKTLTSKSIGTSLFITDPLLLWTTGYQITGKTILLNDNSETTYSTIQTSEKEYCGIINDKRCYNLYYTTTSNDSVNTHLTKVFLDSSDFNCEYITYNPDNTISSHTYAKPLPNPPKELSKAKLWTTLDLNDCASYESYDASCNILVNNENQYTIEIITTYKIKNNSKLFSNKIVYDYKNFKIN